MEGLVIRKDEKGAIVQLPYGLEGFRSRTVTSIKKTASRGTG